VKAEVEARKKINYHDFPKAVKKEQKTPAKLFAGVSYQFKSQIYFNLI
jgi:hypothetical protein